MSVPTILIVDDEPELREAIAFDFRRKKFNVLTAASGNEAFKIVNETAVDVVLSDVCMPDGGGVELLEKLKARNVTAPIVMLITGFADLTLQEAYDKGADAVFPKPFDRKAMMEAVNRAVQPLQQRLSRKESRVNVGIPAGLTFSKIGKRDGGRIGNIGRGGFYVELKGGLPEVGEGVDFEFEVEARENFLLVGKGVVRWVREGVDNTSPGCGVEITELEPEALKQLTEMINFQKTRSFIPMK